MKTRIVYPQLWLDEKFASCNIATKLLFCYLINNIQLGLSPYLHITDRQIMFDTGLNSNQLETGKKELTNLNWCYFTDNWVFQNHKCAYINYEGNEKVIASKVDEIDKVPFKVKEVFKGLITGLKPNINHKQEIINNKLKTKGIVKGKLELTPEEVESIANAYQVPLAFVVSKQDDVNNWIDEKPSRATGRNLKATLRNWVKRDAISIIQRSKGDPTKRGVDATNL